MDVAPTASSPAEPVLRVEGLRRSFGATEAVAGLSLSVRPGEVYGLVGPDGAGKTTTMRLVAGLMTPDEGSVRVRGLQMPRQAAEAHAHMGYMPQQYSLYGDLTVQENLRFFAGMYGVGRKVLRQRQARLMGITRLDRFLDRPAAALSGGMYKKLALACALVHEPRLLLLDEPTNGVDPISRQELWSFLGELLEGGVAVLVSTPYMDEAERCDRVGLLLAGRLVAEGSPAELRADLQETVFAVTVQPAARARQVLSGLRGVERTYAAGRRLHVASAEGPAFAARIRCALADAGLPPPQVEVVPPSFEDIFLALTHRAAS